MTESYKLIRQDGQELEFSQDNRAFVSLVGLGNIDIEYTTQTAYYMDGAKVTNFNIPPRQLNFGLFAEDSDLRTRSDYWDLRRSLLSFLSPANGPMTFQLTTSDHAVYELTNVYPTPGLAMSGNTDNRSRNDWRVEEEMTLTAFDPVWRVNPIISSGTLNSSVDSSLIFPLTFPITFGVSGVKVDYSVTYNGTWRSYPKIIIAGPYTTITITNKLNRATMQLLTPITSSESRIIDLTNPLSGFTITDGSGNNVIDELSSDSNLTQFYFEPSGDNGIEVSFLNGTSGVSTVELEYYTKYLGI